MHYTAHDACLRRIIKNSCFGITIYVNVLNMSIPDYLGKYQILSLLGRGSMGMVYQAKDPDLNQLVAIKTIRRDFLAASGKGEVLQRFKNEVVASRRLKHSHIVAVYEYNEKDCQQGPFIVMEYVAGKTLDSMIKISGQLDVRDVFTYMQQILSALAYAHDKGVVHRDIKPANILINACNQVQIMDFGIAKLDSSDLTMAGSILGTPSYMSPEQCMGQAADARSDLFSAAIVFYEMLTGEKPFVGDTQIITMNQIVNSQPVMPSVLQPAYSDAVDSIVSKALAKEAAVRYQTAQAFADDLLLIQDSTLQAQGAGATVVMQTEDANANIAKTNRVPRLGLILLLTGVVAAGLVYHEFVDHSATLSVLSFNVKNDIPVKPDINNMHSDSMGLQAIDFIRKNIAQVQKKYPCTALQVSSMAAKQFYVTGYMASVATDMLQAALNSVAGVEIKQDIKPVKAHCDIVRRIWPFYHREQILRVELMPDSSRLKVGSHLRLRLTLPTTAVYLNVDYVQADGHIAHLVNNRYIEPQVSGTSIVLGQHNQWVITEPLGIDMLIVTLSENAVFSFAREPIETRETYLNTWQGVAPQGIMTDFLYIEIVK